MQRHDARMVVPSCPVGTKVIRGYESRIVTIHSGSANKQALRIYDLKCFSSEQNMVTGLFSETPVLGGGSLTWGSGGGSLSACATSEDVLHAPFLVLGSCLGEARLLRALLAGQRAH